jgi:hypothetical protein
MSDHDRDQRPHGTDFAQWTWRRVWRYADGKTAVDHSAEHWKLAVNARHWRTHQADNSVSSVGQPGVVW